MDFGSNVVWIVIAIVVLAILAFLLLRPRQRVELSDSAPLRPHMPDERGSAERQGDDQDREDDSEPFVDLEPGAAEANHRRAHDSPIAC